MKYLFANYRYHGKNINNLGDHLQILTVDYLYSLMGIRKEEIVYINLDELKSYSGPPVLLPVSLPLVNYSEHGIADMFSKNITPVFFGLTMPKTFLLPEEVEYYKKHEPIGCRDEQAYNTMRKYDISAYLGGCLTVALPKRKENPDEQTKVFILDPPKRLIQYIPDEIAKEAVWDTHIFYGQRENITQMAAERYLRYVKEARLVITSLLHGSIPCMAFGVPVVLARDYLSYRFAWVESLTPIYTPGEYSSIDWSPQAVEFESHKHTVQKLFSKRMRGEDAANEISQVHDYYMNRKRGQYVVDVFITIQEFIDETWLIHDKPYTYAIWGLTQMAEMTVDYITNHYPNARLTHVYDKRPGLVFKGMPAIAPECIADNPDETVFVTTVSAADTAERFFSEIKKPKHLYKTLTIIR